jgi:hypothetical protein
MEPNVKEMPEGQRRRIQEEAGLTIQRRPAPPPNNNRNRTMQENGNTNQRHHRDSRARDTLERLTEPPSFTEVAKHELKRAAVWIPMLLTTGIGLLALKKRFF